jgi:hypothetical protein
MQKLLDLIVNEETEKADELFHEIVVEMSRGIYENMIAEEEEEEMDESSEDDEEMDESSDDEEEMDESFGADDETSSEIGGDSADAFVDASTDDDAMGGDDEMGDGSAPATKDDVQDLEAALAELKAEFEALTGGTSSDDDSDDDMDMDMSADDEEGDEEYADDEEDDTDESMGLREYRETVGNDWHKNGMKGETGKMAGAGSGENENQGGKNTKSVVSSGKGKPTTGAGAGNIAQAGKGAGEMSGTSTNADKGNRGLVGSTKGEFTKGVEKNISNSANSSMKSGSSLNKQGSGYPSNNKSAGPVGSGTGDKAGQTSVGQVKSPINGAPNRNA